jgi:hypothetical protein
MAGLVGTTPINNAFGPGVPTILGVLKE